jgi:predicted transglutaminase-like cysteine proteinase
MASATRASSDTALEDFCRRRGKQSKACQALWPVIAATVAQPQAGDNASLPSSKEDSSDYFADFCQRRGQQSKVCRAQRRAIKVAKKWEQASPSQQPTQRAGTNGCTWENGCCKQRPRARDCRQAPSPQPTAAAVCALHGNESAAPLAASLWTRALSLPIFCSDRQLQASGEWLHYLKLGQRL